MRKARKAFFSFAIIAVVTAALILFAAYAKSWYGYREVQNYALEARLVDQRANDSASFLGGVLADLLVDSAYDRMGCTGDAHNNATNVCEEAASAFAGYSIAEANLSDYAVQYERTAGYAFGCGNTTWALGSAFVSPPGGLVYYNYTTIVANVTANYTVSTEHANKHVDIVVSRLLVVNRSKDGFFNATVQMPNGRNQAYYAYCA